MEALLWVALLAQIQAAPVRDGVAADAVLLIPPNHRLSVRKVRQKNVDAGPGRIR